MKSKGFTLIELLIVIAIIAIIAAIAFGAFPRKAGAHEATPTGIASTMAEVGASYVWETDTHHLTVLNKGTATWTEAADVCKAIEGKVDHAHVTLKSKDGIGEIRWEGSDESRKLTNLPTSSTAEC